MSNTYPDLTHTSAPDQIDKKIPIRDPSASEIPLVNQYNTLVAQGQVAASIEILMAHPKLEECIINADKLLRIYDAIIAIERFFFDSIQEKIYRIGQLKGDWNAQMSSTATGDNLLNHFDVVRYPVDGVKQYFLVYKDEIVAGMIPTEHPEVYLQLSMKGDKGDAGRDGVDGIDGASGLGMSPRGAYVANKQYYQYDLVSHNGLLWYATEEVVGVEPSETSTVWQKINISLQVTTSTQTPVALEDGGLWLHLQDDGHIIMKTKNESGEYAPLYPETQAKYVIDAAGENLQTKSYKAYFDRDDVVTTLTPNSDFTVYTSEAKLKSNSNIIVARKVLSDTSKTAGDGISEQWTLVYTAYDETGVYVMYKCQQILNGYTDGRWENTPEVII